MDAINLPAPSPVVPIERIEQEVRLRAANVHLIRIILDMQPMQKWTNEQVFGLLACYLADSLEAMTEKVLAASARQLVDPIEVVKDGETVRYAFLGNAAREMYDALKAAKALFEAPLFLYLTKPKHAPFTNGEQAIVDAAFIQIDKALDKAEGRV